jgi:hypothetical protein
MVSRAVLAGQGKAHGPHLRVVRRQLVVAHATVVAVLRRRWRRRRGHKALQSQLLAGVGHGGGLRSLEDGLRRAAREAVARDGSRTLAEHAQNGGLREYKPIQPQPMVR